MHTCFWLAMVGIAVATLSGCAGGGLALEDPATRQMISLLMPSEIIIEPFTGLKSFDDDDQPDGLEMVVRPVDAFGDPVKIAGHLIVELYDFRPASGIAEGDKLQQWDLELTTERDQRKYWNRVTQMYEVPLALSPDVLNLGPQRKLVLLVTYNSPLGEHTEARYIYEPPIPTGQGMASGR